MYAFAPTCFSPSEPSSGSLALDTHNSLKHMLPQHCKTFKVFILLIILQKCNFSKDHHKLPEDGPDGPKHVGANA
jgi:hypothetical protein